MHGQSKRGNENNRKHVQNMKILQNLGAGKFGKVGKVGGMKHSSEIGEWTEKTKIEGDNFKFLGND